jgi:hypothetical protein
MCYKLVSGVAVVPLIMCLLFKHMKNTDKMGLWVMVLNATFNNILNTFSETVVIVWLDLQLPIQSVPITTKVVSSNPVHGEVYSIQHYLIKFVSDLAAGRWMYAKISYELMSEEIYRRHNNSLFRDIYVSAILSLFLNILLIFICLSQ